MVTRRARPLSGSLQGSAPQQIAAHAHAADQMQRRRSADPETASARLSSAAYELSRRVERGEATHQEASAAHARARAALRSEGAHNGAEAHRVAMDRHQTAQRMSQTQHGPHAGFLGSDAERARESRLDQRIAAPRAHDDPHELMRTGHHLAAARAFAERARTSGDVMDTINAGRAANAHRATGSHGSASPYQIERPSPAQSAQRDAEATQATLHSEQRQAGAAERPSAGDVHPDIRAARAEYERGKHRRDRERALREFDASPHAQHVQAAEVARREGRSADAAEHYRRAAAIASPEDRLFNEMEARRMEARHADSQRFHTTLHSEQPRPKATSQTQHGTATTHTPHDRAMMAAQASAARAAGQGDRARHHATQAEHMEGALRDHSRQRIQQQNAERQRGEGHAAAGAAAPRQAAAHQTGKKGGTFVISKSGKKRYVGKK